MTALLLRAVCAPEICIRLVHRIDALHRDAPLVLIMRADLCEILRKIVIAVILQVILACIRITGRAAALAHIIRRGIGEHLRDHVLPCRLDAAAQDIPLIRVRVPVIGHLPVVIDRIPRHIGIRARDVMMRRVIAAADVEARDIQVQTVLAVEQIGTFLGELVVIADAVRPPAERAAPALKHAAVDLVAVRRRQRDRRRRGDRQCAGSGTHAGDSHSQQSRNDLFH